MLVVSSRECRANQKKYFDLAQSNLVVIKSRNHGSFKLIPVEDSDFIMNETELLAKIKRGIAEYEQGMAMTIISEFGLYSPSHTLQIQGCR